MAIDVTDADFEARVIERSKELPVVVDLWAPWCGPCRQLGPVLEQLETERGGAFELVKINVDENPQVAGALGARSIPLVIAFSDGKAVNQFVGAQPAGAINAFLDQLIPSELDQLLAAFDEALDRDDADAAETILATVKLDHAGDDRVRQGQARLLAAREDYDGALALLAKIPSNGRDEVANLASHIRLKAAGNIDLAAAEAAVDASDDPGARIELGQVHAAQGNFQQALDILLEAVRSDPGWEDGAARKAMIDLFGVMGADNPLTREYRSKLSSALF